jgi:hypothetical protein
VSRLREQIALEYQAAYNALHAPAMTAPHAFINAKLSNVQQCKEQLARIVGDQQATELVIEVMEQMEEVSDGNQARPVAADQSTTTL